MAAVTQIIPNYVGGVSTQPDERKLPGQVTEATNVFVDATFGLTKRPGLQYLTNLNDYTESNDPLKQAAWFAISRDEDEQYFGAISNGVMHIWNAIPTIVAGVPTYTKCTIEDKDGNAIDWNDSQWDYFDATPAHGAFKFTTVQDVTYIINSTKTVEEIAPTTYNLRRRGTIRVLSIDNGSKYSVFINGSEYSYTLPIPDLNAQPPDSPNTAETLIDGIAAAITASGITVTKLASSIELSSNSSFTLDVKGGISGNSIDSFQDDVGNVARLPNNCVKDRRVKIINTADDRSSYFVKFVPDENSANPNAGNGYWEEDLGWSEVGDTGVYQLASVGLDASTMPYILANVSKNVFRIQQADWTPRLVGSEDSNSPPSFVGSTISEGFVYANRLGFLSDENVILSQSGEFTNFYFTSAQTVIDSDPVDLNCSSIRPAQLHAVIPQAQGLVLFSQFEQFIMFSDDGIIRPSTAQIRSLANYESEVEVDPVDVGTQIYMISKSRTNTRTLSMITRGLNDNPIVVDISKTASEYVPADIDNMVASPQNSFVIQTSQNTNEAYFYRFFNNGERDVMQAWFKWTMPGTVQTCAVANDQIFMVLKNQGQYVLCQAYVVQDPQASFTGLAGSPRLDYFVPVLSTGQSITYNPLTNQSFIPTPFANNPDLTPTVVVGPSLIARQTRLYRDLPYLYAQNITADVNIQGGQLLEVTRDVDGKWYVSGDYTGFESRIIVGWQVTTEVELPTTYFRLERNSDYTANLTLARMKFSCGTTGEVIFQTKQRGSQDWVDTKPVIDADYYLAGNVPVVNETIFTVPIHQRNTNIVTKIVVNSPFPFSLNSMMWEGNYSPRFYRRT